jgi:hypothetical protein
LQLPLDNVDKKILFLQLGESLSKPGRREVTAGDDVILEHHLHCASFRRGIRRRRGIG